jgi:fibro-slime domain-containing protein
VGSRQLFLALITALSLPVAVSCGARTELDGLEICGPETEVRACRNACGIGTQTCRDGYWQACEVAPVQSSCEDACGTGTQRCVDGAWQACEVEPVSVECWTECGAGTSTCNDGAWGSCDVPPITRDCMSVCGFGTETCSGGTWQACTAPQPKPPKLKTTVRDFNGGPGHPDFERAGWGGFEPGIVEPLLGPDDKPVFDASHAVQSITSKDTFDQWYRDVAGVNFSSPLELALSAEPGTPAFFVYSDNTFFPIDNELFGNQGRNHNFHFTLEAQTTFTYVGGEEFSFEGDDDMWVFVNRHLAIDLGGLHVSMAASVDLDDVASEFGLAIGGTYPIHFFFAERHTIDSNFTIRTTVAEAGSCE